MKIAVSAMGKTLDSDVDPRFGRSSGFVIYDTGTGQPHYVDNSARREQFRNTGIQTAQDLIEAGIDVLITGQIGPNAANVMKRSGVRVCSFNHGTVQDAVSAFEQNSLEEFEPETIERGPGKMGGRGRGGGGRRR
ncbi:MAG: NifB/NifX family molybdenum-iron cluster-binding protein [Desulfobacterales bacterium]